MHETDIQLLGMPGLQEVNLKVTFKEMDVNFGDKWMLKSLITNTWKK